MVVGVLGGGDVMHRVILIVLLMIADGVFYSAHAQCAPTDKIYIDPRLVPRRPQISERDWLTLSLGSSPEQKAEAYRMLREQNQPIVIHMARARS